MSRATTNSRARPRPSEPPPPPRPTPERLPTGAAPSPRPRDGIRAGFRREPWPPWHLPPAAAPAVTETRRGSAAGRSGAGRAAAGDGSGASPCPPALTRRGVPAAGTQEQPRPQTCSVNVPSPPWRQASGVTVLGRELSGTPGSGVTGQWQVPSCQTSATSAGPQPLSSHIAAPQPRTEGWAPRGHGGWGAPRAVGPSSHVCPEQRLGTGAMGTAGVKRNFGQR